MLPTRQGGIRLFKFAGIDVYLHYSWFVVAVFMIQWRAKDYTSPVWNVLEYLGLFVIVLLHEFGHALACRSVGGVANQIVLWPLGGVAYVDPPRRPGATLWSIAAGPLVNVVLFPLLSIVILLARNYGIKVSSPDLYVFFVAIWWTNLGILIFNVLPVYPLDGGQILQSLLWFAVGRARSLLIVSIIGFVGVAGFLALAVYDRSIWLGVIALFAGFQCLNGYKVAQALIRLEKTPRHMEFACPECQSSPPKGPYWTCQRCRAVFDTFLTNATCPSCNAIFATTRCVDCGGSHPISEWNTEIVAPPRIVPPQIV